MKTFDLTDEEIYIIREALLVNKTLARQRMAEVDNSGHKELYINIMNSINDVTRKISGPYGKQAPRNRR